MNSVCAGDWVGLRQGQGCFMKVMVHWMVQDSVPDVSYEN